MIFLGHKISLFSRNSFVHDYYIYKIHFFSFLRCEGIPVFIYLHIYLAFLKVQKLYSAKDLLSHLYIKKKIKGVYFKL